MSISIYNFSDVNLLGSWLRTTGEVTGGGDVLRKKPDMICIRRSALTFLIYERRISFFNTFGESARKSEFLPRSLLRAAS